MFFLLTIDPSLNNNKQRLLSTTTLILFAYWYKCTIFGFNWQTYTEVWQLTWYFQFILSVVSSCQQVWLICHVHLLQLLNFNCTHRCHWRTGCLSFLAVQLKMHHRISPKQHQNSLQLLNFQCEIVCLWREGKHKIPSLSCTRTRVHSLRFFRFVYFSIQ